MASSPNYSNVSLQLNCDGAVDSTVFTDVGPTGRTVTTYAGAKVVSDATFTRALNLDGSGYLEAAASSDFNFGSGDFTVECWAYFQVEHPSATNYKGLIVCDNISVTRGWLLLLDGDAPVKLAFATFSGATTYSVAAGAAPALNTWHHIAATRSGTSLRLFLNGALQATTPIGTAVLNGTSAIPLEVGSLRISSAAASATRPNCRLTGIRITKGVAVYTAAFTPPAMPLPAWAGQVSGVVRDDTGVACARIVRAYRRDTGALVDSATSDAGDGTYTINCPTTAEVQRVVLDDAGGTLYNDIIDRVIPA